MSHEDSPDRSNRPAKRSKTELACDTCRKRKSRCDGRRPNCSHCENMGFECIYRPPLSSLDTDGAVLARLAHLESRIQAMDQRRLSETTSSGPPSRDHTLGSPQAVVTPWPKIPEFHHAAAHKMFHYWSKLRINISPRELEPLQFFKQVDDADAFLVGSKFESQISGTIYYAEIMRAVDLLFEEIMHLPFILRHLLTYGGLSRTLCIDVFEAHTPAKPDHTLTLNFVDQSAEELLIETVALKHLAAKESSMSMSRKADLAFRYALERMWMMQSQQSRQALPFKFLFVIIMLYLYGRPFHALGILQSLESLIHNASPNSQDDPSARPRHEACLHQYFLLESDILTEIDGVPSQRLHNIGLSTAIDAATTPPDLMGSEPGPSLTYDYAIQELHSHLKLRGYLNSILSNLYTTERAYCQPNEIAVILTDIARRLDIWYWSLPLDMRFPRHPAAFLLTIPRMSDKMDELRFRYHAAIFLVNRPVLYFVLYETMEHAARSPGDSSKQSPWVYESCYSCVQNAVMIILLHLKRFRSGLRDYFDSWCNIQHLIAACAIIIQVQNSPTMSILLKEHGDPMGLLDAAETVIEQGINRPANVRETLGMIRNIRQNFQRHTPRTPSISGRASSPVF